MSGRNDTKTPRRVRAADVAAAAGVSTTAVSFVLNRRDAGNISPATRQRVLQAAEELGYRPNHVARSLRRNSTSSIGLVTDSVASSPFGGRLLAAATEAADQAGFVLLMMDLDHRTNRAARAVAALEGRQVDAVIYAATGFTELDEVPASTVPLVLANCVARAPGQVQEACPSVGPDDAGGARAALNHLADLGHRHVVMLGGHYSPDDPGDPGNVSGPVRWRAFVDAGRQRAVATHHVGRGWSIADGYAAADLVLSRPASERPTAFFAACDRVATGALLAAARQGLSVPEDLSVIGFDDQEEVADSLVPPLTTVALPHALMGRTAVDLALGLLADGAPSGAAGGGHLVLPCPVVVRGSTAAPSSR